MDNEMIDRCIDKTTKLIQGYTTLGLKTPINEIVITCITAMREPTEKMVDNMNFAHRHEALVFWYTIVDGIIND